MKKKAEVAFSLGSHLVEFRIDALDSVNVGEITENLSEYSSRCILTVRSRQEGGRYYGQDSERVRLIGDLSKMKPAFSDIELVTAEEFPGEMREIARNCGRVIVSWHDFAETPAETRLLEVYKRARSVGDIAKIVTNARRLEDNLRVLSLYRRSRHRGDLIAFCMG